MSVFSGKQLTRHYISLFPEFGKRRPLVTVGHRIVSKQRCRTM